MDETSPGSVRPPVALGCTAAAGAVILVIFLAIAAIMFLESGANTGKLVLDPVDAYARGSVEFVGQRNFYVVRLADGSFVALSDLDAANRTNPQHRCRVAPLQATNPDLPGLVERYGAKMSAQAAGSTLLFREECNKAVYDVSGLRLDAEAPNLERYPVSEDGSGRLVVDVSKRICSAREGAQPFRSTTCK